MPVVPQLARWSNPLLWRSPRRNLLRLASFARAERNTLVELEHAANLSPNPERAAAYLSHAADEHRHARMFMVHARHLAERHGLDPVAMPHTDSAHLYRVLGEVGLLAFMHHGEGRARLQFESYRDHLQTTDARGSRMFTAILADEARHEAYTLQLLKGLADPAPAIRRARLWEAWRTLRTLQRSTADSLFALGFLLLLPLFAVLTLWIRQVDPSQAGWITAR